MTATRRQVLKWSAGLATTAGAGLGWRLLIPPSPSRELAPARELTLELYDRLREAGHAEAFVPYDHPLRQFHNRGVDIGGVLAVKLDRTTRSLLVDLFHASLSPRGRERIPRQFALDIPGVHLTKLLFSGSPHDAHHQVHVTGPHLNLRIGGKNREGVAFGGPQVYGDQRGNGEIGLPGSIYRDQLELGQRFVEALTSAERKQVRHPTAPPQTAVEVQGRNGTFDGISLALVSPAKREMAKAIIAAILDNYASEDSEYAWECISNGGGIEAFHFADYDVDFQGGRRAGSAPSQVFRLESPGAVFHYRGEPHLHALFNVAMDAENPLSLGERLGENPKRRDTAGVARFFDRVMREQTGSDFGFYPLTSVGGRLRVGTIRTGDIYSLESWRSRVVQLEARGSQIRGDVAERLREAGAMPGSDSTVRIATIDWVAGDPEPHGLGRITEVAKGPYLRGATVEHLRRNGFA